MKNEPEVVEKNAQNHTSDVATAPRPSMGASLLVFTFIAGTLVLAGLILGTISIHTCLILSVVFTFLVGKLMVGISFDDMMKHMAKSIGNATFGMWFFVAIGAIIGTWMLSGTVPAIIYYGLGFITPSLFVPIGFILCSLTALATGSSWTTIGTVGIALMGMGEGMGIPIPVVAAIVIGGATFGDKMSPISDIPNLASIGAGCDIFSTIKAMVITMAPSYIIALVMYTILGFSVGSGEANFTVAHETREVLAANFDLGPVVFLPIVVLIILNIKKAPPLATMTAAVATAILVAVLFQGATLDVAIESVQSGFSTDTGSEFVNQILNRGGFASMYYTFTLVFLALSLGGLLEGVGFIGVIIEKLASKAKSVGQLSALVIATSAMSAAAFADTYMPIVLNGTVYKKEFDKRGLHRSMLARLTSEGVHMWAPLMVWNAFGAFAAGTLGIDPMEYIQYAYLNLIAPFVSIGMSFLGIGVLWNNKANKGKRSFNDIDLSNEPAFND